MKPQKSFTAKTLFIYTLCRNKRSMPKCSNKYSRAVRLKNMENFKVFLSSYWGTKINIHRFGILATGQKKCLLSWWDKPPDTNFFLIHEIVVGCYRTQHFSVVVVHTRTLPFIPHPHCNRTRTRTQTLWKYAVQMST